MATSSPPTELTGRLLGGRYRLNRPIASGGMAQVFEATDEVLARRVAVKILHPHLARDHTFVQRFRAEAVAAARLTHPSIVSVYDTVVDGEVNAIVMELVRGTTLRADLDAHGPLQLAAVLAIGTQVADALAAAHASGLVHRDVKPANILLSADGRVLVADFGIAKAAQAADHDDGAMVGTAKYLAPEQVEGRPVDARTDIYALGVVLYEALTGVAPFAGGTDTETALMRLTTDPVRPRELRPDIPAPVEAVVGRALARDPQDRYADAISMRRALVDAGADPSRARQVARQAVADAVPPPAVPPPAIPPPSPAPSPVHAAVADPPTSAVAPAKRRRSKVVVMLALAAVGAVGGLLVAGPPGPGTSGPAIPVVAYTTFDPPPGSGGEHDGELVNLSDADPATVWSTETYTDRDVTTLKPGVGLVASIEPVQQLSTLDIVSPSADWSAQIMVVDGELPADLSGWGTAVATVSGTTPGRTRVDLSNRRGRAVMVWFTDVGKDHAVKVQELQVYGR